MLSEGGATMRRLSRRGKIINKPWLYIGLVILVLFTLGPFAWLISSSFQKGSELLVFHPM